MTSPATLQLLLEAAERERDQAQGELQAAVEQARRAHGQLVQLTDYRIEYAQRWTRNFQGSTPAPLLHYYQGFGRKLDGVIDQQGHTVAHQDALVAHARQRLVVKELRVATIRTLIERRRLEQLRRDARREQREMDEFAQRMAAHRDGGGLAAPLHDRPGDRS